MTMKEAIRKRHSVRSYTLRPIDGAVLEALEREIQTINRESGLSIRLVRNEQKAFTGLLAHYGRFENAVNYFALIGKDDDTLFERCGYWGERLVLFCEMQGLNTCWVAGSYKRSAVKGMVRDGEKLADLCQLHIYSDSQMEARIAEKGRDSVNSQANQDELKTFDNLILAGEYSVVILEPWLYRRVASGGGFRKLSDVLGSKPASAYDDCAVRFKETALYNANPELFAGYTDDTLICLRTESQIFAGKRTAKTYAEYEKLFADLVGG